MKKDNKGKYVHKRNEKERICFTRLNIIKPIMWEEKQWTSPTNLTNSWKRAKLHFTGTTSWYFNQRVDENINNWHNYQMLIKISKAIDKNVNNRKGDNLTKI